MDARGELELPVGEVFKEGQALRDAYSGRSTTVSGGIVQLKADGYVLLEAM